jgi:hypothetical protein
VGPVRQLDDAAAEPVMRRMHAADRFVTRQVAALAADFPGVEIAPEGGVGPPAELLVNCSATAWMVVAGCPVAVVR